MEKFRPRRELSEGLVEDKLKKISLKEAKDATGGHGGPQPSAAIVSVEQ